MTASHSAARAGLDSELRLRAVISHAPIVLFAVDCDGVFTLCEGKGLAGLGLLPGQLTGRSVFELGHPLVVDNVRRALAGETFPSIVEVEGSVFETWYSPILDDDCEITGVIGVATDITERKRAEAALRASETRFRALVQNASDVVVVVDRDGRLTYVSPAVERVLGYAPGDLARRTGFDFIHPADLQHVQQVYRQVIANPGTPLRAEFRARHRDGRWRWLEATGTNQLNDPSIEGIVGSFRDITSRKRIEHALRSSEELFRSLAASTPVGIIHVDREGRCLYTNARCTQITGLSAQETLGFGWTRAIHPEDRQGILTEFDEAATRRREVARRFRIVTPSGETRWVHARAAPVCAEDDSVGGFVGSIEDVTSQMEALQATERLTAILEATPDYVGIADVSGRNLYINEAGRRLIGIRPDELITDTSADDFYTPESRQRFWDEAVPAVLQDGLWRGELILAARDGRRTPISQVILAHRTPQGEVEYFSTIARDVTERKAFEAQLEHQALHDPLTLLPNRALFGDRLAHALARSRRQTTTVAVLFLDLDRFKMVNDSLGHDAGDRLLVILAERLQRIVRPSDTVARFAGDEFTILCEDISGVYDALRIAERVLEAVRQPFELRGGEVVLTASVGIAIASGADDRPEALLRDADAAMYRAKERGKARYEIFDEEMRRRAVERLEIESDLRRAIERRELRLFYQPVVTLDGTIVAAEALVRWQHPTRGLLTPGAFMAVAEDTGLVVDIGRWVLEQAVRQIGVWRERHPGAPGIAVSVNLSARELAQPDLAGVVARLLRETRTDPSLLYVEMTENVLMSDAETILSNLQALKDLGVGVGVDDFGTGYSSLSHLRRFPVDIVKVDRSFVSGLGFDRDDSAIVAAVVSMAHELRLHVVAEGVESTVQLGVLRSIGCDYAQGYLFARPQHPDALDAHIQRGKNGWARISQPSPVREAQ